MTLRKNLGTPERIITSVAGGLLIAGAAARPSLVTALLGALGAGLLARGASGYCPIYAQLGASTLSREAQEAQDEAEATESLAEGVTPLPGDTRGYAGTAPAQA